MSGNLSEVQARQSVVKLKQLTSYVKQFTSHAKMLSSAKAFDGRVLMEEANKLLKNLQSSQGEFLKVKALSSSLSRSLSSKPPADGGMAPAAKWMPEIRAGSKQFIEAVREAEKAVQKLYDNAEASLNVPTRTATSPDNLVELVVTFIDLLHQAIEWAKTKKKK